MAEHMRTELVSNAVAMAVSSRGGKRRHTIFHSDRGSQYMSTGYQKQLIDNGLKASVGRTGVCWDNAVAESFFSSLKREQVSRNVYADRPAARKAIFKWVNQYNNKRLHSRLGYTTPAEWENRYNQIRKTPAAQKAA